LATLFAFTGAAGVFRELLLPSSFIRIPRPNHFWYVLRCRSRVGREHAEICVRVDADCVMGPDALVYSVPWFRDPEVGIVGAMQEPRTDTVTWFHRLRSLEVLFQFRFARLAQSLVDGVVVISGTLPEGSLSG
jgi:cellulose synthase/poly-beta-1,6-N-acetylglucosamine synthase-like glycosyltransferase